MVARPDTAMSVGYRHMCSRSCQWSPRGVAMVARPDTAMSVGYRHMCSRSCQWSPRGVAMVARPDTAAGSGPLWKESVFKIILISVMYYVYQYSYIVQQTVDFNDKLK